MDGRLRQGGRRQRRFHKDLPPLTPDECTFLQFCIDALTVESPALAELVSSSPGYMDQKFFEIMVALREATGLPVKTRGDAVLIALCFGWVKPPQPDDGPLRQVRQAAESRKR